MDSPLYERMSTLRAVRRLRPDPIPDEVLERVLQAACWAPSGGNQQPWRIIAVRDQAKKQALQDIYLPEWRAYSTGFADRKAANLEGDEREATRSKWQRVADAGDYLAEHLAEAPVLLVFCANARFMAITDSALDRPSIVGGGSVYPAVQNAMLACVEEGLGCTLTTLHCLREPEVLEVLEIPEPWFTGALVPIGYPVGKGHGPITRKSPSELVDLDTFGQGWGMRD